MRIEIYDYWINGERLFKWRMVAPNGRPVCESAEPFLTRQGVRRSIANFTRYLIAEVPVEEVRSGLRRAQDVSPKIGVSRPRAAHRKAA